MSKSLAVFRYPTKGLEDRQRDVRACGLLSDLLCRVGLPIIVLALLWAATPALCADGPASDGLERAIRSGDFSSHLAELATRLNQQVAADAKKISESAVVALLERPDLLGALARHRLISKHGVENLGEFARADPANADFLGWLLRNTQAMDLYLLGATPTGRAKREADDYALDTGSLLLWRRILEADPDAREGIYLKLAIAVALAPPQSMSYVGAGGMGAVPIDPVERYLHFKRAHQNHELFPIFDTLSVWEYRMIVPSWASDAELGWARQLVNTWRPDLRANQQVHRITSEVKYGNSPFFYTKGFVSVIDGGGKCGPRSWFGRMTCRAFGIPAVGVGQPGHAAFAVKAADPASDPQPGSVWKVVYGRGWQVSRCEGVSGVEFLAEAQLRSHRREFAQGEHLRWLAAALGAGPRAEAVLAVARSVQDSVSGWVVTTPLPLPETPGIPEPPIQVPQGVIHIEAEAFARMSGVRVLDCFTGGKQVNFDKNINESWVEYALEVPADGTYLLIMRIAAPNRGQVFRLSSEVGQPAEVKLPNTRGLWETTEPVRVQLAAGARTLRITAPYQRGVALRWWEMRRVD